MERKSASEQSHAPNARPPVVPIRPWTAAELRLPMWLRGHRLPKFIAEHVEREFHKRAMPSAPASLLAMLQLASAIQWGILKVRREHNAASGELPPDVLVQNVVFHLRSARDELLQQTPAAHISVVNGRLDRLIDATKSHLAAVMAHPLEEILCDNPTCPDRGKHLLPGPWEETERRYGEAAEDAFRVLSFLSGVTPPSDADFPEEMLTQSIKPGSIPAVVNAGNLAALAFDAATRFVENLAVLSSWAREPNSGPRGVPLNWDARALPFAEAFIAWDELTHMLTPSICTQARLVYPVDAAPFRLVAQSRTAPVVPAMPGAVSKLLTAFRRVELGTTLYLSKIEAVADELGTFFRNAVYPDRRHPLDPDSERIIAVAKARATARQVAHEGPAEPLGWGVDYHQLARMETREDLHARLGIKTNADVLELMMREWTSINLVQRESVVTQLRCDGISFAELRINLMREAESVVAAASKPSSHAILSDQLEQMASLTARAVADSRTVKNGARHRRRTSPRQRLALFKC